MKARVALSTVLALLALLPSLNADPPWARPSGGQGNFRGPPGHAKQGNKHGGQTDFYGNGPPGGGGPPGLSGGGPPGLSGGKPPGWAHGKNPNVEDRNERPDDGRPDYGRPDDRRPDDRRPDDGRPNDNEDLGPRGPDYNPGGGQTHKACRKDEFRCTSGECQPGSARCDDKFDCRDSSDEENCPTRRPAPSEGGCVLPEQPEGGTYELGGCGKPCYKHPGDKVPRNSILTYACRDNYVLEGNTISVCVNDEWYNPPSCLRTCPALSSTSVQISCTYQGEIVSCNERIKPGTRAKLACKRSYKLPLTNDPGFREVTCLQDGLWDRRIFRCLPECGTSIAQGNTLVVNGFEAKVGIFPWHVGIYNKREEDKYEQICGGTLISTGLVVSAAHCFYDEVYNKLRDKSHYYVAAGKHYRDWNAAENYAQKSPVSEILLADRYIGARGNFAQDIALIKLKTPFELTALVGPICLDWDNAYEREQLQVGQTGKAVGWGKTIAGAPSTSLQEVNMPFVPYDQCLSAVPDDFRGYITSDKFCAGRLNGSSLCEGDSGGGLCFQLHGTWYLRGVVSVSPVKDDSCDYNSYVGFTYVSYFLDWIRAAYLSS